MKRFFIIMCVATTVLVSSVGCGIKNETANMVSEPVAVQTMYEKDLKTFEEGIYEMYGDVYELKAMYYALPEEERNELNRMIAEEFILDERDPSEWNVYEFNLNCDVVNRICNDTDLMYRIENDETTDEVLVEIGAIYMDEMFEDFEL